MNETGRRARTLVHRLSQLGRSARAQVEAAAPEASEVAGFDHRAYASDNADVAAAYGDEDAGKLKSHFDRYGRNEGRGVPVGQYCSIESVVLSEDGFLFLSGWADRRLLPDLRLELDLGYVRHTLKDVPFCWYHRADVSQQTGDMQRPAGFLALVPLADVVPHARLRLLVNGQVMHQDGGAKWLSPDRFLTQVLNSVAVLADQPVGATLAAAEALSAPLTRLWQGFLDRVSFVLAYEHRPARAIATSIIIAPYRNADMLLPQLETLTAHLDGAATEVIVVANALQNAQKLTEQLRAFCQIHDVALRLYLCSDNSGFSAANNFGADRAQGDVLIFMNPDIFPPEEAPGEALAFLDSDPGEALEGALLYYGDGLLMHSGMYVARDIAADAHAAASAPVLRVEHFGKGLGHRITDDAASADAVMADIRDRKLLATAALWKIRKSVFADMGGLSTDYLFAYYEDADFCLRLLDAGREIRIDPRARWIHMEGVGKAKPPNVRAFMWLNRALFSRRFADSDLVASDETDLFQL